LKTQIQLSVEKCLFHSAADEACRQLYDPSYKPRSRHELMENIKLQKEIIHNIKGQPWRIKRKLKTIK